MGFRSFSNVARAVAHNPLARDWAIWPLYGLVTVAMGGVGYFGYRAIIHPQAKYSAATRHAMFETDSADENKAYYHNGPFGILRKQLNKFNNEHGINNNDRAL